MEENILTLGDDKINSYCVICDKQIPFDPYQNVCDKCIEDDFDFIEDDEDY